MKTNIFLLMSIPLFFKIFSQFAKSKSSNFKYGFLEFMKSRLSNLKFLFYKQNDNL